VGPDRRLALLGRLRLEAVWLVLLALVALMALLSDSFLTSANVTNILRQVTIVGLVAIGMAVVLIGGNFDLSTGATVTLAAVVSILMQPTTPLGTGLAILVPLLLGLAVGAANGLIIGWLRANSIIVTVGMQFVVVGIVLLLVGGQHVRVDGATALYVAISEGYFLGVPNPVYLFLGTILATHFLMTRTVFGRYVRALGGNLDAARLAGIPTGRFVLLTLLLSGFTAALSGIVLAARVRNLDPTAGIGYEFAALTAVVLGGTRLTGGHGSLLNTLAGVLVLGVIANGMTLLNLSFNVQLLVQGLILVAAVAFDARSRRVGR
jgi:ribose transport system permease protein